MIRGVLLSIVLFMIFALSWASITTISWLMQRDSLSKTSCIKKSEANNSCMAMCCLIKELKKQEQEKTNEPLLLNFTACEKWINAEIPNYVVIQMGINHVKWSQLFCIETNEGFHSMIEHPPAFLI
ncbi:MAG: hypothetical protein ACK5HD_10610 [Bacteroidota bacterium]|jgi:hypothetical protein